MSIEEKVFNKSHVDFEKLEEYGFKKIKDNYTFSKTFMDNDFKAVIFIDKTGKVSGKIYDMQLNEEYTSFKIDISEGNFVSFIRENYENILNDIRKKVFYFGKLYIKSSKLYC